jgi:hypothetical protein
MRKVVAGIVVAGLVGAAALLIKPAQAQTFGFKGKLEVSVLQLGYTPVTKTLKVRAQTVALAASIKEYETSDGPDIDRILRLAELKSRGAQLAVEIDGSKIKSIDVAVGGPFLPSED